ncbi:MAG: response regulator [bacterium]|nr:response regulator [bacterium]
MNVDDDQPLKGLRILVVEDNYVLAESMRWALEGLGCQVVGPAPTSRKAFDLIDAGTVDVAILDIDLQGKSSAPVAERLRAEGRPFLFLTGYESAALLPPEFHNARCLSKPVDPEVLASSLLEEVRALEN